MKNFVHLFGEKEGSTAIVQLLAQFNQVHVVRAKHEWEPFDAHVVGAMSIGTLVNCIDIVLGQRPLDADKLNRAYSRTSRAVLMPIDTSGSVGFKMRFRPPQLSLPLIGRIPFVPDLLRTRYDGYQIRTGPYRRLMFDLFRRLKPVVFVGVRQDVLRWSLSRYHGDGTGQKGHLQFKLAAGEIRREDIAPIHIDMARLGTIVTQYEARLRRKRKLFNDLRAAGVHAVPLLYERFVSDKARFVREVMRHIEVPVSDAEIDAVLSRPEELKRVHSNNISEFVVNHEEVQGRFGNRFVSWEGVSA